MSQSPTPRERPLSPHLQVYKPQLTSVLSITHRATGVVLYFGSLFLVLWLVAAAFNYGLFVMMQEFWASRLGQCFLLGWSLCLFYHLLNGVRHLCWDMGHGLELRDTYITGYAVLIGTALLTLIAWVVAYGLSSGIIQEMFHV